MANVTKVSPYERDGQLVSHYVGIEGREKDVPCYDAEAVKTLEIGKPLPEGWEVKVSKAGKDYLAPPKAQGAGRGPGRQYVPRYIDTKEGAEWQDRRIDRRRALELAVSVVNAGYIGTEDLEGTAEDYFNFLTAGGARPEAPAKATPLARPATQDQGPPSSGGGATREGPGPKDSAGKSPAAQAPRASDENPWAGMPEFS